jgi:hypothetical protein
MWLLHPRKLLGLRLMRVTAILRHEPTSLRPPQNQGKKRREDFNQAPVRIVEEAAEKHEALSPIKPHKPDSPGGFVSLRSRSRSPVDPLLEHLAPFSEFWQILLVVYLPTLHAAN